MAGGIIGFYGSVTILKYFPVQIEGLLQYLKIKEPIKPEVDKKSVESVYISAIPYEQAIIDTAKNVSPSVVSIVISKNLPVYEQELINPLGETTPFNIQIPQYVQKGTEYQEVGAGSGFIVTANGLVLTNKHVVSDKEASYTVFTNDGEKYDAKVLALDPVQDLALIKIGSDKIFSPVVLGDSSGIQIGQTAIAIGNSLGQFSNTVSVGIVSGLGRTISASSKDSLVSETLENIIQTDAAINSGNSGGPLLNLRGEVIGINTAMADGAEAIGFAIPINMAKKSIDQVIKTNKIVYPFLGVRYVLVDDKVKKEYKLSVDNGALVLKGDSNEPAVTKGSAAEKAGIKEKDIILEVNGEKITTKNSIATIVRKYNVGDTIILHILRNEKEQDMSLILGERSS
ncbi:MAG: trypsin-like peptidase domain-containing protein [Candidatus Staskawiczbacteria bacterium]